MRLETGPLPSPQDDRELPPTVEMRIGLTTAMLAATLAGALWEHQEKGKPTRETTRRGGELLGELVRDKLRLADFDAIARAHGRAELYNYRDANMIPLDDDWLDMLLEAVAGDAE
jgi:hypothetical protein